MVTTVAVAALVMVLPGLGPEPVLEFAITYTYAPQVQPSRMAVQQRVSDRPLIPPEGRYVAAEGSLLPARVCHHYTTIRILLLG